MRLVEPARTILEYYKAYSSDNYIFPILDKEKHSTDAIKATTRLQTANKIINKN